MWNGTATRATEKLHVGDCIEAVGRLQSREYIKDLGDKGKEPERCYELSVNQYELQKKRKLLNGRIHTPEGKPQKTIKQPLDYREII